jgi:hypothetical protein
LTYRFLFSVDPEGVIRWGRVLGGSTSSAIGSTQVGVGSSVFVYAPFGGSGGQSVTFDSLTVTNSSPSSFLLRLDPRNGDYLSVEEVGGSGDTFSSSLAVDGLGYAYVSGKFNGSALTIGAKALLNSSPGYFDGFIAKFSPTGALSWAKRFGGGGDDDVWNVDVIPGGTRLSFVGVFRSTTLEFGSTTLASSRALSADETNLYMGTLGQGGDIVGAMVLGTGRFKAAGLRVNDADSNYVAGSFVGTARVGNSDVASRGGDDIFILKAKIGDGVSWANSVGGEGTDYFGSLAIDGSRSPAVAFDSAPVSIGTPTQTQIGARRFPVTRLSTFFIRVGPEGALN